MALAKIEFQIVANYLQLNREHGFNENGIVGMLRAMACLSSL